MIKMIIVSALWCPSCLLMYHRYEQLKADYPTISIERLDYDSDRIQVKSYNITKILPVLIVMQDNQEIARLIGEKTSTELNKFIRGLKL